MQKPQVGDYLRGKKILDIVHLSDGWIILKTENSKSTSDFKVKTVYQTSPRLRYYTPKHAHFAIDFYGKICADKSKAMKLFNAIIETWDRRGIKDIISKYQKDTQSLPGYSLEYTLYALNWILEQEDINFTDRPINRQQDLDDSLSQLKIKTPRGRRGSQLAISLFCNIALGEHPVNAFMKANIDVLPRRRFG
jgi:hypothetical protein